MHFTETGLKCHAIFIVGVMFQLLPSLWILRLLSIQVNYFLVPDYGNMVT